ncbi:alpha/beta fold hydrolase [Maribius pontilimi]|uniref:Alpha/beta fold hydrolase n=1 Tax=Palleronia pontilimi TaxID=1964209 RepID=A0A934IGF7_9RHOB|nr:alpha/beta fold hydrolase [Palleronia pontilimi]MBJ3762433.1 alpha/beta fold hydrolase [Palleronia pontilimi]
MSELLLIHGSCHGAWCWRDVLAELDAMGQPARAIDLPGHGDDATPRAGITMDDYVARITGSIDAPVTLVGHSMGGFPITHAALTAPDKITRLVYVCAYVPEPGKDIGDMRRAWPDQPLVPVIEMSDDGATFTFDAARLREMFYHDCPEGTLDYARPRLTPQPVAAQSRATEAQPDCPRSYIICDRDRAIPPGFQAHMVRDWPAEDVQTMDVSHSPFFAAPRDLARRLADLARRP